MAALGGRFASELRSVTGGDLGLCTSLSGFNLFSHQLKVSWRSIDAN